MPPENSVGLDDDERSPPSGPQVTEPRPEQPVNGPQPRAPAGLSLQDYPAGNYDGKTETTVLCTGDRGVVY